MCSYVLQGSKNLMSNLYCFILRVALRTLDFVSDILKLVIESDDHREVNPADVELFTSRFRSLLQQTVNLQSRRNPYVLERVVVETSFPRR